MKLLIGAGDVVVGSSPSPRFAAVPSKPDWTPGSLAGRVAVLQSGLVGTLWIALGYLNARHTWLLEDFQQALLRLFFWRELPILGAILVVALPAWSVYRLADEIGLDITHDAESLTRILAYPRRIAVLDMAASALFFFFGAVQLRLLGQSPAIEAAKIVVFGFLTGVLFGVASFFLLQPIIRPILLTAAEGGASPAGRSAFPLTQKIIVSCVALSFVVTGLFGEIALSWAQRFAEARAEESSRSRLRALSEESLRRGVHDSAGWRALFESVASKETGGTILILSSEGMKVAWWPASPAMPDRMLIASDDWRESAARIRNGSVAVRRGDNRVVTSMMLPNGWRILVFSPPDPAVLRDFLRSVLPVGLEIVILSVALAWAVGWGISRPVRDLERRTRRFGEDPDSIGETLAPTDDEIGSLTTSFRRMEEEIRAVQAQLRETERRAATAELLAGVAHEVRNPLFGITSTAAALEGELRGNDAVAPHLAVIRKESDRLSRMMEEMLALQRMPNRGTGPVPILPVLDAAAASIRSRLAARSPQIVVDAPFDLEAAHADRDRLESVFGNLFENAVLSSEVPVHIAARARAESGRAVVEVEDDGPGLASAVRDRIFEPFVTARAGGTGIGLAVTRQIVLEHGGSIEVKSPEGGPTVFTVRLPSA